MVGVHGSVLWLSLSFFFLCLSFIASVFLTFTKQKRNASQRLLPSPFSIPFGAIDSTLSLPDMWDSLHDTDSEKMGFYVPPLPASSLLHASKAFLLYYVKMWATVFVIMQFRMFFSFCFLATFYFRVWIFGPEKNKFTFCMQPIKLK